MANAFWEEFKKIFKTKQTLNEEEAQAIADALENEGSVVDALKQLEKQYKETLPKAEEIDYGKLFPESLGLSKVEFEPKSDDELKKQAETELADKYINKLSDIDSATFQKAATLKGQADDAEEKKKATLAEIESLYSSLKDKAEKDAIKRGLGRSSIITERLNDFGIAEGGAKTDTAKSFDQKLSDINSEIESLDEEKQKSLESLNLSHAAEISKRIDSLASEREKLKTSAITANNKIAEQEAAYQTTRQKQIAAYEKERAAEADSAAEQLKKYEEENGYSGEKLENFDKRYKIALDFYLTLDADVAPKALAASANMKYYLGNNYKKLLSVLTERADKVSNRYSN